jgi:hypothetical protein
MPSKKKQGENQKKAVRALEKIPTGIPGSSAGVLGFVMRKLTEISKKNKEKTKKGKK